jgi:dihydrofolate reductase
MKKHHVFIATSLDGYIADAQGEVGFLDTFPMPDNNDMGYGKFMEKVDALLMGRKSFETFMSFGVDWHYTKPVFIWSQTLEKIPTELAGKAELVRGTLEEVESFIHAKGFQHLYLDGGQVIQSFLQADKVETITITTIPVLIGDGIRLFGPLTKPLNFRCTDTKRFENGLVQQVFERQIIK